ncbi:MAG: hypothetical protein ABJL67_19550 [Sulfitobacter sp.]
MYRKFIAAVAATAITLTALGASSASADQRRHGNAQANTIAALLGLAVVGAIIHEKRKDKKEKAHGHHKPAPTYTTPKHSAQQFGRPSYQQPNPRPLPARVHRKVLPSKCLRSFDTRRGHVRMFGSRCLNQNFKFANRLPQQCQYVFDTSRGNRRGYDAHCLRDHGYRSARG